MDSEEFSKVQFGDMSVTAKRTEQKCLSGFLAAPSSTLYTCEKLAGHNGCHRSSTGTLWSDEDTVKRSAAPEGYKENVKKTVTFEIEQSLPNQEYEGAARTAVISVLLELALSLMNKDRLSDAEGEVFQNVCNVYGLG